MADGSRIEWTDATWNFLVGCDKVSSGCANCYAVGEVHRLAGHPRIGHLYDGLTERHGNGRLDWTGQVRVVEERLTLPLRWKHPKRIFVNSLSDLFHDAVPDEVIARAWVVMALARRHVFQILTKRPERMVRLFQDGPVNPHYVTSASYYFRSDGPVERDPKTGMVPWPLPNVWLGVSVENQQAADERIPLLLATPAAVHWISCEPLLGPVDLTRIDYTWRLKAALEDFGRWTGGELGNRLVEDAEAMQNRGVGYLDALRGHWDDGVDIGDGINRLRWVVAGGESGPRARPCHPDWARSLRDQCVSAGVPFLWKQWGEWLPLCQEEVAGASQPATATVAAPRIHNWEDGEVSLRIGKRAAGRLLDGTLWDQMPEPNPPRVQAEVT